VFERFTDIGTEHILLGLVRENEGVAARILLDFDADDRDLREDVIRARSGAPPRPRQPRAARNGLRSDRQRRELVQRLGR
jgi:ATP-dependent Clp protease ATP-binding subunit ClpC